MAWAFYGHRLKLYRQTSPHSGFSKLFEIGESKPFGYFVFTSNVDGQFQKAGFDPERITECHGSIHHFQCTQSCNQNIWDASLEIISINEHAFKALPPLPTCPHCGALARPNVLMFRDWSWNPLRTHQQELRMRNWLHMLKHDSAKIAIIEIGAGTAVASVRHWTETLSRNSTVSLIRINPREAQVPSGSIGLALNAGEGIQRIHNELRAKA